MPWVATDRRGGVWIYYERPATVGGMFDVNPSEKPKAFACPDFPNPPLREEEREFRWSDVVASDATERVNNDIANPGSFERTVPRSWRCYELHKLEHNQVCPNCKASRAIGVAGTDAKTGVYMDVWRCLACGSDWPKKANQPPVTPMSADELRVFDSQHPERVQPAPIVREISLAEFSDEDRPVAAVSLVRIIADVAKGARKNGWSVETLLEIIAERIGNAAGLTQDKR